MNDDSRDLRAVYTLLIVIIIILILALYGWLSGAWEASAQQPKSDQLYQGIPIDAHLLAIDRRALEDAYHGQLIKLWGVWLSDGAGDTTRIMNGLRIARRAYGQAAAQIEKRQQQQQQELERR